MFIKFCYPASSDVRPFLHKSSHKRGDGRSATLIEQKQQT
jgi:hypothetical protein